MIDLRFDPTKPLRYARYGRMSTNEQNPRSPDQQFDEIARTLQRQGRPWIACGDYRDDGVSGRYMAKRAGLMRLIEDIKTGRIKVDVILVDTLERFGRMEELEAIRRALWRKHGVLILTADSGFADPTSIEGKALGIVENIRSTQDTRVKAHNVMRGKKDAAQLGHWPGGPAPKGYKFESVFKNEKGRMELDYSTLIPDPETAWLVKLIYELAHKFGWGGNRIAQDLNLRPEVTAKFGRIHADTVNRILGNTIYRGELTFNNVSTDVIDDRRVIRRNPLDQLICVPNFCEPLVTEEVWFKVREIRQMRSRKIKAQRAGNKQPDGKQIRPLAAGLTLKYELSGMVRCAICGAAMRPNKGGGRSKGGKDYVYYMCPSRQSRSCTNPIYLPVEWLRKAVFAALRRRLFPSPSAHGQVPDWFPQLMAEVQAELEQLRNARQTGERPLFERERKELHERQQGWALSLANRDLPAEARRILEDQLTASSKRIAQLEGELAELDNHARLVGEILNPKKVLACLHRLDEVMAKGNPTATNLELARHIARIEVFPEGKVVMYTCRLGAFEGVVEMLARPHRGATPVEGPSGMPTGPVAKIKPRMLGRRAADEMPITGQGEERSNFRAEDPARFEALGLNWFWKDEFESPLRQPWYQEHAAEVQRVRQETRMSLEKLAKHFGKSKPTIMRALKYTPGPSESPQQATA